MNNVHVKKFDGSGFVAGFEKMNNSLTPTRPNGRVGVKELVRNSLGARSLIKDEHKKWPRVVGPFLVLEFG